LPVVDAQIIGLFTLQWYSGTYYLIYSRPAWYGVRGICTEVMKKVLNWLTEGWTEPLTFCRWTPLWRINGRGCRP